jgi:hypothetical protein
MENSSGHSGRTRPRRFIMACVVVALALMLALEMARNAPLWCFIAPVTGIVSGLLYLGLTRRCR